MAQEQPARSIRSLLVSDEQRERRKAARPKASNGAGARWTAKRDGEGQFVDGAARQPSRKNDDRYRRAVTEAAPELERITDAASKGVQAVLEACLDYDEGGRADESLVTDAVETYSNLVMSEVQTRLKSLQNLWISQKVAKKKSIDDRVLSLMAEIRDGREREREDAERARSALRATNSQQVTEDLESQRVELVKGVRAEIATQFADLGGFPLLRGEAKSELEQRREDREAGLAALRVELEKKLGNQQDQEKRELKDRDTKLADFREKHGEAQVRRMLKLNSQIAIETAHVAELKRKLEAQRAHNVEKERTWAETCGQRVAAATENLRLDTIRAEQWREKQVRTEYLRQCLQQRNRKSPVRKSPVRNCSTLLVSIRCSALLVKPNCHFFTGQGPSRYERRGRFREGSWLPPPATTGLLSKGYGTDLERDCPTDSFRASNCPMYPTPVAQPNSAATILTDGAHHAFFAQKTERTRGETNRKSTSSVETGADKHTGGTDSNGDGDISREAEDGSAGGLTEDAHFEARKGELRGEPELPPAGAGLDADSGAMAANRLLGTSDGSGIGMMGAGLNADSSAMAANKLLGMSDESGTDMIDMNISLRQAAIDESQPCGESDIAGSNEQRQAAKARGFSNHGAGASRTSATSPIASGKTRNAEGPGDSCSGNNDEHDAWSEDAIRKAVSTISAPTPPLDVHNECRVHVESLNVQGAMNAHRLMSSDLCIFSLGTGCGGGRSCQSSKGGNCH
jgi:hypothetical protein